MLAAETYGYLPHEIEEIWTADDLSRFLAWVSIKRKDEEKAMKEQERKMRAKTASLQSRK